MAERLSPIERLGTAEPTGTTPGILRIRPVVVDSSSLVPDVVWSSRQGRPSRLLASVDFGLIRPFAAHHVWAEVPRRLRAKSVLRGVDPGDAIAVWLNEYVPRIRVVDVSDRIVRANRILTERDASDAPTAALLDLIGPVVVLADDRDLVDLNLAAPDWPESVSQGYAMTLVAQQGWGALLFGRIGGLAGIEFTRSVVSLVKGWPVRLILACIGAAVVVTAPRWTPRLRPRLQEIGSRLKTVAKDSILPLVTELVAEYQEAARGWENRMRGTAGDSWEQVAARILASSPIPLSRTQLARLMLPDRSEVERRRLVTELAAVLQSSNSFVAVDSRRWQLGWAGANFGGVVNGAPVLDRHRPPQPPFYLSLGKPGSNERPSRPTPGADI